MEGVKVSIDRIVVDFTNVYWTFFNPLRQRLCDYYNASFYVKDKGFKYRVRVRDGKHWVYLSYQLVYARLARKHTLRLECPSRLWRSDIVRVLVHREFKKYGVDVKSIEQPTYSIHKKDPSDFLINGLMELLDQYQRLEIALKLGRGRNKKAQQGGYAGGRAAFGYKAKKGQKVIEINLDEALAVQRVFELKELFPDWSLSQLAFQMNYDRFTTQQGKSFTKVQVKRILDRKAFYEGLYLYGDIQADGLHQAIL